MILPETNTIKISQDLSKIEHSIKTKVRLVMERRNFPSGRILRIEEPISNIDPLKWLHQQNDNMKIYWSERDGDFEMAGVGSTCVISGDAAASYQMAFARMKSILNSEDDGLRFYGGFRFDKNRRSDSIWKSFGSYLFFIPQLEIVCENGNTKLALNIRLDHDSNPLADLIEEVIGKIEYEPDQRFENDVKVESRADIPDKSEWSQNIEQAKVKFGNSDLKKIVLARRSMFNLTQTIDAAHAMGLMKTLSADAFHFCIQPEKDVAFMGASPELLYRRTGNEIFTEAIAGTRPRGEDEAADEKLANDLLDSAKEVREHDFVCQWIEEALMHLCRSYETDDRVRVLKSSQVQHLYKRYRGKLKARDDAKIISMLHPTPAVAGTPREKSLQGIRELESFDRGWYAGPVGCVGSDSAEFAVGIRSGLLAENRLHLFSGAGILPESNPQQEWQELEHKIGHFLKFFEAYDS